MQWPSGWASFERGAIDDHYVREYRREASIDRVLAKVPLRTIGIGKADDVLFELLDGSGRLAAVHLTFSAIREADPQWPDTQLYNDWDHFVREGSDF
jgi:hypothetical protein